MRWAFRVFSLLLVMMMVRAAEAQPTAKPILVLEAHVKERPAAVAKTMAVLQDQLETRGLAARPASVLALAGDTAARPGRSDPDLTSTKISEHMSAAWLRFVNAEWKQAEEDAKHVLAEVEANPELVVNDTSHLDLKFKVMIARLVALDHLPQRSADVSAAATEVIRGFPARSPGRVEAWGKRGEELHAEFYKLVQTYGRGMLIIAGGDPLAQIFIEGALRGVGNVSINDMIPGVYNIYIVIPNRMARRFRIRVSANDTARLTVSPVVDACLWLSPMWTGVLSCAEEAMVATQVAQRDTQRDEVVVLRSGEDGGRWTITGRLYRGGKEIRNARIFADDDGAADDAAKLAAFLVDGEEAPGLAVQRNDARSAATNPSERAARTPSWSKATLGVGGVGLAGSLALYLAWPDDKHDSPEYDDKKTLAVITYSSAAVVAGVGMYGWLTESRRMRRLPAGLFSASMTSLLTAAMLIPTDEDPDTGGGRVVREHYRDTGLLGVGIARAGIGFAVAGYLTLRFGGDETREPTDSVTRGSPWSEGVPVFAAGRDGVSLGWTSAF
jgi:hypothetical protein